VEIGYALQVFAEFDWLDSKYTYIQSTSIISSGIAVAAKVPGYFIHKIKYTKDYVAGRLQREI